eukprot:CAMPEP_0184743396 /NCGR_PEP_ID=MMETSP0315-20130426/6267_1 /TAXON_ID=101924 /ORGANISM="Rhodosorus marinus, Strain UTEX LB 2760" /LENGTH=748 /DNA_ID=CAMNT_0027214643 /DNA_START=93 /DNA_END=2339 /DNA_ORIENTATION=-
MTRRNGLPAPGEADKYPLGEQKLSIVFVGAEVSPWAKTGGLGDVMRDLPLELAARGHRVMSITPRYDQYAEGWDTSVNIDITVGKNRKEKVSFFHCYHNGVDRVFVDHPSFLEKIWGFSGSKIYGPKAGVDFPDGPMRFSILCQAAMEACLKLHLGGYPYGSDVLFVPNDWHAALLPLYMKAYYRPKGFFNNAKTMFILHNIVFQGRYPVEYFDDLNLPKEFFEDLAFESCFCSPPLDGESDQPVITEAPMRMINILKAGFIHSDRLLTVSPSFAEEVMSGQKLGCELDDIIRAKGIIGIVNGMDMVKWNPMDDKFLVNGYDAATAWLIKRKLKVKLQAELGLKVDPDAPLVGFVGRLDPQKGIDLLMEAIPELIDSLPGVQFVLLGTGQAHMMRRVKEIEAMDPTRIAGVTKFSEAMEHKLVAAADFMAMPSRFEPCGLVQLHAMRYGCVPIVTNTGGLKDSVVDGVTGYLLDPIPTEEYPGQPLSAAKLAQGVGGIIRGIKTAVGEYGSEKFKKMQKAGMNLDMTWTQGVQDYETEIKNVISVPGQITKSEAQLVRGARNGGVASSMQAGISAGNIPYPWSKNSISVDQGIQLGKSKQNGTGNLAVMPGTKVPPGGPISTVKYDIRGGAGGQGGGPNQPTFVQASTGGYAPQPSSGPVSGGGSNAAQSKDQERFVGIFKKIDGSKPVQTGVNSQNQVRTNYAGKQIPAGTRIDSTPKPRSDSHGGATGSLSQVSVHHRPTPTGHGA